MDRKLFGTLLAFTVLLLNLVAVISATVLQVTGLIDPGQTVQPDQMMDKRLIQDEETFSNARSARFKLALSVVIVLAMIGLWRFTPLKDYLDAKKLIELAEPLRENPLAGLWVLLAYVIGGLTFFPVTVQIVATSALFHPVTAFLYSLAGCLISAVLTFVLGHCFGRDTIREFAGVRLNKISIQVARKGVIAVAILRLVPIAPFTLINLVAGASHIRFRDYLLGTFIGMLPGIVGLTLLTDRLMAVLIEPRLWNVFLLLGLVLIVGLGGYFLKKRLNRPDS